MNLKKERDFLLYNVFRGKVVSFMSSTYYRKSNLFEFQSDFKEVVMTDCTWFHNNQHIELYFRFY